MDGDGYRGKDTRPHTTLAPLFGNFKANVCSKRKTSFCKCILDLNLASNSALAYFIFSKKNHFPVVTHQLEHLSKFKTC
jgi:hypothetical protein